MRKSKTMVVNCKKKLVSARGGSGTSSRRKARLDVKESGLCAKGASVTAFRKEGGGVQRRKEEDQNRVIPKKLKGKGTSELKQEQ